MKPLGSQHASQLKHIVFLYAANTHLLQGLNVLKGKPPIVWKVSGSAFLFNLERRCLADTGRQTHIYEVPSQCPVKFAISLHDSEHYQSREHNPLGQETRAPLLLSSANRCAHVPQLPKSRLPFGTELQQLHICRGGKLSAKTRGGSHPPPPACKASSAFVPLQMTPRWVDLIIHTCMPVHNASKIPGLWQHLTWAAHSNRAYQQALGKRPCRRRENPCSGVLLI